MKCRPGDIAVVVSSKSKWNGMLVEVLYLAPRTDFTMPDGFVSNGAADDESWLLRIIGPPRKAKVFNLFGESHSRLTSYGVGGDRYLRPLRGDPDAIDTDQTVEVT